MSPTRHRKTTRGCSQQVVGAVARACAVMRGRCARALEQSAGFTLTEALTTVIIVGLVTTILAGGIGLATEQYTQQMRNSEAQMLYSSLQKILDNELRVVEQFEYDEDGNVTDFESKHYMAQGPDLANMKKTTKLSSLTRLPGDMMVPTNPSTPGQLAMATGYDNAGEFYNPLLPSAAYNYGLQASVKTFTYNSASNYFTLHLVISRPNGETADGQVLIDKTFTVRPLNYSVTGSVPDQPQKPEQVVDTVTIAATKQTSTTFKVNTLVEGKPVTQGSLYSYKGNIYVALKEERYDSANPPDAQTGGGNSNSFVQLAEVNMQPENIINGDSAGNLKKASAGSICIRAGKYYICKFKNGSDSLENWQVLTGTIPSTGSAS